MLPLPKKPSPSEINDLRSVALMATLMKVVLNRSLPSANDNLDDYQFSSVPQRVVEDAGLTMLNMIYDHLKVQNTVAQIVCQLRWHI